MPELGAENLGGGRTNAWRSAGMRAAEVAAFALLFFVTRFVARGHLVPQMDQECHIGAIAADLLRHGVRFPLYVYAPNEYDNGSFFSGALAAVSFSVLGRNLLSLKLVTHVISACGAVAALALLRCCLVELGYTTRRVRYLAIAALAIGFAFAPRLVTMVSMQAVGNHAEGSAIDTVLLALFVSAVAAASPRRVLGFWILVGIALYLNKGTFLVIPILGLAQLIVRWGSWRHLFAALGGFVLGILPELTVILSRHGLGWFTVAAKAERNSQVFPQAFLGTVGMLGEYRPELLGAWAVAIIAAIAVCRHRVMHGNSGLGWRQKLPLATTVAIAASCLHLLLLMAIAKNGLDVYAIYGYPTAVVLYALLLAGLDQEAQTRWGRAAATWTAIALTAVTVFLYRPHATDWGFDRVASLWRNRAGAACTWRFAEGFERQYDYSRPIEANELEREQYAIRRCREFDEPAQVLDCIGGVARELNWRQRGVATNGEPPPGLSDQERRAYAYEYGTHRKGRLYACNELHDPSLQGLCLAAAKTECLVWADFYTGLSSGHRIGQPHCDLEEPPFEGYWSEALGELRRRHGDAGPVVDLSRGDDDLGGCEPVYDDCFGAERG